MPQQPDQWKQKYLDSLNELEQKEQQWQEIETLLRRGVSRLTLLADGKNSLLDRHLEKLRNSVRSEKNTMRLKQMLDEVIELGSSLEQQPQPSSKPKKENTRASSSLRELVVAIPFPRQFKKAQKQLVKKIEACTSASEEHELVGTTAKLLTRVMMSKQEQSSEQNSKGVFGGLFSRKKATAEDCYDVTLQAVTNMFTNLLDEIELPEPQARELSKINRQLNLSTQPSQLHDQVLGIARIVSEAVSAEDTLDLDGLTINEVLMRLIERLEFPSPLENQVTGLQQQLSAPLDDEEIAPVLENIADMALQVRQVIEQEKNDIEEFLKQMMQRLQDIEHDLEGTKHLQAEAFQSGRDFGHTMQGHVDHIHTTMQKADDLELLKSDVSNRLESIQDHMDEYRSREEHREQVMRAKLDEMKNKLESVESEADKLREQIVEEHNAALQDALTEIPNRLAYNERMEHEYRRWQRYKKPLSLIIWDVDDFKNINDTYGHKAGDRVLRTVAQVLSEHIRQIDFIARYGGEEFITLLPETDLQAAKQVADKLCESVATCDFHHGDEPVKITISGGVAQFQEGDDLDSIVSRADGCLYAAKRSGKNRCMTDDKAA